jgi:hypothetical protein
MTVNTTQVATSGSFIAISSENATLTTALSEVINEMEAQSCPMTQTEITATFDSNNNKYAVIAIVKRHGK